MRYFYFLIFFFWTTLTVAQTDNIYHLNWHKTTIFKQNKDKVECLSFNNAALSPDNNWLPIFCTNKKIKNFLLIYKASMQDTEFSVLSSNEKQLLSKFSFGTEIEIHTHQYNTRDNSLLEIKFIPIRKNPVTQQLEKLVRFKLKVEATSQVKKGLRKKTATTQSVLQKGKWIKIAVDTTGIHKLTFNSLKKMGLKQLESIRVYGYGGAMLPKMNNEFCYDDLPCIPIYIHKGSDGVFNKGDYILFYAKGTRHWKYSEKGFIQENHQYANKAYYFLTTSKGKSPTIPIATSQKRHTTEVTSFDDYRAIDHDKTNLIHSGRLWVGDLFDVKTSYSYHFLFDHIVTTSPLRITTSVVARAASDSYFSLKSTDNEIGNIEIAGVNTGDTSSDYARIVELTFDHFYPTKDNLSFTLTYHQPTPSAKGWLNFINVNARRKLYFTSSQMAFRDTRSIAKGNISQFKISNCKPNCCVWNITNPEQPKQFNLTVDNGIGTFSTTTETLKEFVVFNPQGNFPTPKVIETVPNQNLHGILQTDMLIVAPKQFTSYAKRIADYHKKNDNLNVTVVTQEAIFNEFSSGTPDVAAIRNFVRMLYQRPQKGSKKIKYLLLFGDGSYDNKSMKKSNTNKILTYQSKNALNPTLSFVSDDFFGLLDDNEGEAQGLLDIGIGRLPVNTIEEAKTVTNKIINYTKQQKGNWQTKMCFIADDEDENTHVKDANTLAETVATAAPQLQVKRIFLDNYTQVTNSAGQAYPEVNKIINSTINKGCLIMNYTGHGNEKGLAHEHVLTIKDIQSWQNKQLPLFITASCEFSRFDNYRTLSAGEIILLRKNGGGIGLLTTTRLVYSLPNFTLNKNFYKELIKSENNNSASCLGDILRRTKNATPSGINKRNFILLGDPALRLPIPQNKAYSLQLNGIDINKKTDTLKAMSVVKISGNITNKKGDVLTNFRGTIYPTIYDKAILKSTKGNDGNPFTYKEQNNVIYKGKVKVNNGTFQFSFFVPKDINYKYGKGKIHYYANDNNTDAAGFTNNIIVGGTNVKAKNDNIGPEIKLYLNNQQFTSGATTNNRPLLLALLSDTSGINTIGTAIGHHLTATLDQDTSPIDLNDFYESDLNTYQKGTIQYQFNELKSGAHTLKLKAWDNMNNSSESDIDFIVADNTDLAITHLLNYPNPFTTNTAFYFEQNKGVTQLDVLIQILTISGKLIKTIGTTIHTTGNKVGPITWNGKDDYGNNIGRGVYFYRVRVRTPNGQTVNQFQKLVILK